ncbi:ParB N-terminal domain-containing protein [Murimonas intestini]|uniref:ParB N-terminal domain-containing protein n=1 Tax=Murimonas intestini TaxID=1337051 RepID=UPI0011DCE588|nr:ParB N-terminal domain-containing protein [Murimonas intestini]
METIAIGGKNFQVEEMQIDQQELLFYIDNPRVYSALRENGNENPTQYEIETKIRSMEHVKELRYQIEQNGGLIEALIVVKKDNDYIVLEGNSRLAAYRILADNDPVKWKQVRCNVLPNTITEAEIFTLIGTLHLVKKKDWTKYEQAAYVYRQQKASGLPITTLAKNVGLSPATVKRYIEVYEFMKESKDNIQPHWNFYEQYVTNSGIKKYRGTYPEMDKEIVSQIKLGKIKRAEDIRDKLGKIAKSPDKTASKIMRDIIDGNNSLDQGFARFEATGKSGNSYKKIKEFRDLMTDSEFLKSVKREASGNKATSLELKKINKAISKLLREIGEE